MSLKVGINGFGRIGRLVMRAAIKSGADLDFVAVNDLTDTKTLAHLFKYDSVHGIFDGEVKATDQGISVNGDEFKVLSERDPGKLPWKDLGVELVLESTGLFGHSDKASAHLDAGAKRVIISQPAKGDVKTIVVGVNDDEYDPAQHKLLSNASCTTNCLAPFAKVLDEKFGIVRGLMTTIHAYTNDQKILDLPHSDLRRARAAHMSMIPTKTGAAEAVSLVLPNLKGKLTGGAIRVPVCDCSLVDLVAELKNEATEEEINAAIKSAAEGELKGILAYCDEPLVSVDFIGNPHSSIFDALSTKVIDKKLVKVLSWYDNEWGFSNRVLDLIEVMRKKGI
ncbi:MAG: type I glyceraldehyde-3-phosphate dehydrogenase [Candidatus Omnitrophica bacterium]|nr:type I glyceraldehyde-3-phosphate dehydrogenase [Candidatus Omnitrophota bacterium]MCA9414977.1 type I glyceraldehyde-3-phosphate dehydrogenase [Candidatus Omnitrophota bacterium]MCA9423549.1 type I glyceraldehyde-3-phosphate dehydrogenase [Candidatus Omnitrophota bacterium]MCA9435063.1 type I glyceraldehyde-3-phosphate dehydrogenase [Candidatus Omnitrophota bacterium]MCA9440663.1 type I glyceraldehyde-3-phosphate dehydrogenase [Candidatus Omnitrophota bacterium]